MVKISKFKDKQLPFRETSGKSFRGWKLSARDCKKLATRTLMLCSHQTRQDFYARQDYMQSQCTDDLGRVDAFFLPGGAYDAFEAARTERLTRGEQSV